MRRRAFTMLFGGASITWPRVTHAQQRERTYNLAILAPSPGELVDRVAGGRERTWTAFFDEMRRLGYEERHNLAVAWHSSRLDPEHAADLARTVAAHQPDAIFTPDARMTTILRTAAAQIPVVAIIADPVGSGVAASLARPGGNVTGFTTDPGPELNGKRLEILRQAVPTALRVAWLGPRRLLDLPGVNAIRETVRPAGMTLVEMVLEEPIDAVIVRRAFGEMTRHRVDAVWVAQSGETRQHRRLIADLAIGALLPSIFGWREDVEVGGLLSYGSDAAELFRRAAGYVDRIFRGAKPGELAIQQPTRFELVVNLKTARALGLTISPAILGRADEVIE